MKHSGLLVAVLLIAAAILALESQRGVPGVTDMLAPQAPELSATGWINSEPLTLAQLRGKVVLVDFWTYTCINCIRTLPYLKAWDATYRDKGLVIIGVHTPEFEFEKSRANVEAAVQKYGLKYAVAQDNDYATWRAFKNSYWPRKYLIDRAGRIVYDHIGEGGYEETEAKIQELLAQPGPPVAANVSAEQPGLIGTPELYFGANFLRQPFGNAQQPKLGETTDYALPEQLQANRIYLEGPWLAHSDNQESVGPAKIVLGSVARKVNLVMGAGSAVDIEVLVDGEPAEGADVRKGSAVVQEERLYNLYDGSAGAHALEIRVTAGVRAYAFTFG